VPFKSGFLTLAIRGKAAILPMAISGCFEAWPRFEKLPGPGQFKVIFGESISYEEAVKMEPEELHRVVESKINELFDQINERSIN
ncbi:MAG: hypothetical protein ACRC2T_09050, partial [Thermoguttaceae bacterium]